LSLEEEYRTAIRMAIIYLNDEEKEIFEHFLGEFRQVRSAISKNLPTSKLLQNRQTLKNYQPPPTPQVKNWNTLLGAYNKAVDCIRNLLNPEQLKNILKRYKFLM